MSCPNCDCASCREQYDNQCEIPRCKNRAQYQTYWKPAGPNGSMIQLVHICEEHKTHPNLCCNIANSKRDDAIQTNAIRTL